MKLMYDEGSLGEVETLSELAENLQHYDSECFIGPEHNPGWEESILAEKPHLFSLGKDIEKVCIIISLITKPRFNNAPLLPYIIATTGNLGTRLLYLSFVFVSLQNVYTAHVLTLQDEVVYIGQLNQEGVHAIWADLAFELLYLTNDDEERHSIQAHPTLLRNLTIQAADPPLGYFVYSSGIIRTP